MEHLDVLSKVKQLVAIESTDNNPEGRKEAFDFARSLIDPRATVELFESNGKQSLLAYYADERPECFDVILNAHVDVVPGNPEQSKPYIEDGKLYGRGSYDMKAAAIVMVDVFNEVASRSPMKIGLQITTDEEHSGINGTLHQAKQGVRAKFGITGEGNSFANCIYTEARGVCRAEVEFQGKSAHGAYTWLGDNALSRANRFCRQIENYYPHPEEEAWVTTANLSHIGTSNTVINRVPDDAVAKFDFRYIPEDKNFATEESATQFLQTVDQDAIVKIIHMEPAVSVPRSNPYLQKLTNALQVTTGHQITYGKRAGASDARHYARFGVPMVEFGPVGAHHHADGEFVGIDSLGVYRQTLLDFLSDGPAKAASEKTATSVDAA